MHLQSITLPRRFLVRIFFPAPPFIKESLAWEKPLYAITRWLIAACFYPQIILFLEQDVENDSLFLKPQSAFFTTVHL
jgi:hypothetical protein